MSRFTIHLTDVERDTGVLSPQNLFAAVDSILVNGIAIVENAIPTFIVDQLNERMLLDTERLLTGKVANAAFFK